MVPPKKKPAKKKAPSKKVSQPKGKTAVTAGPGRDEGVDEFWEAAEPLMGEGLIAEGTIMGGACVRAGKEFVAMPHHKGPGLVVKLPKARVAELIEGGTGQSFAPAGKVFSEWVLVEDHDEKAWQKLLRESVAFVTK